MMRVLGFCGVLGLGACGGDTAGGGNAGSGDRNASIAAVQRGEISATSGALIFGEGEQRFTLSVPPSAVASDTSVAIGTADGPRGAQSAMVVLEPESTVLAFPGAITIGVDAPSPDLVVARVTDSGLERLAESTVDTATGEVSGVIDRFGRFVVVDGAKTAIVAPSSPALVAPMPAPAEEVLEPVGPDLAGTWIGQGAHAPLALRLTESAFAVLRDGRPIRAGTYVRSGDVLTFEDANGRTEAGTLVVTGDEMLLSTAQSGDVRLVRAAGEVAAASDAAPFFAVEDAVPAGARPAPQAAVATAARAPSAAPEPVASATAEDAKAPVPAEKKGFFGRIGSGIKNAGKGLVNSVKRIGKSTAEQSEAAVQSSIENSERAVAGSVDAAGARVTSSMEEASRKATGAVSGAVDAAADKVTYTGD